MQRTTQSTRPSRLKYSDGTLTHQDCNSRERVFLERSSHRGQAAQRGHSSFQWCRTWLWEQGMVGSRSGVRVKCTVCVSKCCVRVVGSPVRCVREGSRYSSPSPRLQYRCEESHDAAELYSSLRSTYGTWMTAMLYSAMLYSDLLYSTLSCSTLVLHMRIASFASMCKPPTISS